MRHQRPGVKMRYALLACVLTLSCSFGLNPMGYNPDMDMPLDEAWKTTDAFTYMSDGKGGDYWKSPNEFERDGGGDCEDFAAYLVYLLGEKANASMIIVGSGENCHAIIRYQGHYLEPQVYGVTYQYNDSDIVAQYDYAWIMGIVTMAGTKNL